MKTHFKVLLTALLGCLLISPLQADDETDARETVDLAHQSLERFLAHENLDWMRENIKTANGLMLIPKMISGGFIVGGSGGHAVLFSRDTQSGKWSGPAFFKSGGISVGLQAGGKVGEILVLVRSEKALESLMENVGKFSAAGSVTAGPAGEGASTNINAELVTYGLSKGAYAGVSVGAMGSEIDEGRNSAYYGKAATPRDILLERNVSSPYSDAILATLTEASK
mgnify:FL=1